MSTECCHICQTTIKLLKTITIIEIIANAVFLGGAHRDGPAGVFAEILMKFIWLIKFKW